MSAQLRTIPPVRARPALSWWLLRGRAGNPLGRMSWPVFRTRRELDDLRGMVNQLEYMQESLLETVDRLLQVTEILPDGHTEDGTALPTQPTLPASSPLATAGGALSRLASGAGPRAAGQDVPRQFRQALPFDRWL